MARTLGRWSLVPPDAAAEERLQRELGTSRRLGRLLVRRGLGEPEAASKFLEGSLAATLRSPMLFADMRTAASRLLDAIRRREPIAIYGDYDVDGITASTQLSLFLRELGVAPMVHVPHRLRDGYGLRAEALCRLADRGARLVVTADCGAASHAEIAEANRRGVDVIVCDHHQNPAIRPPALAVLNPVVERSGFPFSGLCAAGVAFYLLMGARMLLRETGAAVPDLRRYLDLVALGTVADLVPLREENRVLVKHGLREIARSRRMGLRALLGSGDGGTVTVDTLAFRLAPRLNASGRLADATRAIELLSSEDEREARRLADLLEDHNRERRSIEQAMFEEAQSDIEALPDRERRRSFVLASEGWHVGVLGIVASRLVERHCRPVVLLAVEGERARGSARGIPPLHLFEILSRCSDLLERFGGHRMAAGLTLRTERMAEFVERFEQVASAAGAGAFVPELEIDDRLDLDELSIDVIEEVERLEPYGPGNARPLFLAERVLVVASRVVGEGHLKLAVRQRDGKRIFDAFAFRRGDCRPAPGGLIDVVFTPEIDRWDGRERLRLKLVDLRESSI